MSTRQHRYVCLLLCLLLCLTPDVTSLNLTLMCAHLAIMVTSVSTRCWTLDVYPSAQVCLLVCWFVCCFVGHLTQRASLEDLCVLISLGWAPLVTSLPLSTGTFVGLCVYSFICLTAEATKASPARLCVSSWRRWPPIREGNFQGISGNAII